MKSVALCVAFAATFSFCGQAAEKKPNIVYLLVDDMGFADCGFNGGKEIHTPNIDALAREGSIFKSYYVQPLCSASRAALLAGRFPIHNGIYGALKANLKIGLPLEIKTLAQTLQGAGYTTAITGKWHLGDFLPAYLPTKRGFEHQYGFWHGQTDYFTHGRGQRVDWYRDDKRLIEPGYSTHLIADEATRLIKGQAAEKPLFLYVAFNAVHSPFQVPTSYEEPYASLPPARRTVAGMLSAVDEAVGKIVKALDEKHLRDNTLIIFSSDNGGVQPGIRTNNTPLRSGKGSIYEGGMRVSAFAVFPEKIPAGKSIDFPTHIVDWYPTLSGLAGAPSVPHLDGVDIWPLLTKGTAPTRDALFLGGTNPNRAALRMGDWKLLKNPGAVGYELYDLANDISESKNLAAAQPDRLKQMQERLEAMLKTAIKPLGSDGGQDE